jgi:hypothetical protein
MDNEAKIISMLEKLVADVGTLKDDVATLKSDITGLKVEMAEVKERIIIMEYDNKKNFGALYDGYSLLHDVCYEIRGDLVKLSAMQDKHDFMIKWFDANRRKSG